MGAPRLGVGGSDVYTKPTRGPPQCFPHPHSGLEGVRRSLPRMELGECERPCPMLWECLRIPYPWPNQWAASKLQGQAAASGGGRGGVYRHADTGELHPHPGPWLGQGRPGGGGGGASSTSDRSSPAGQGLRRGGAPSPFQGPQNVSSVGVGAPESESLGRVCAALRGRGDALGLHCVCVGRQVGRD